MLTTRLPSQLFGTLVSNLYSTKLEEHFGEINFMLSGIVPKIRCVEKCATFWATLYTMLFCCDDAEHSKTACQFVVVVVVVD